MHSRKVVTKGNFLIEWLEQHVSSNYNLIQKIVSESNSGCNAEQNSEFQTSKIESIQTNLRTTNSILLTLFDSKISRSQKRSAFP